MRPFSPRWSERAKPKSRHWWYCGAMSACAASILWVMVSISSSDGVYMGCVYGVVD